MPQSARPGILIPVPPRSSPLVWLALGAVALLIGVVGAVDIRLGLAGVAVLVTLSYGLANPGVLTTSFAVALAGLLTGYAFAGRSFAYLGVRPLFVGELVLGLGLLSAVLYRGRASALRLGPIQILLMFAAWGVACTLPYFGRYGLDAARDAALWGYGAFAVLIAGYTITPKLLGQVTTRYARLIPWYLLWIPPVQIASWLAESRLPRMPGTTVPILSAKPGDFAVHLAGIAAFLLLGLHRTGNAKEGKRSDTVLWVLWLVCALIVTSRTRGGMVSIVTAMGLVLVLSKAARRGPAIKLAGAGLALGAILVLSDFSIDLGGRRNISLSGVVAGAASVTSTSSSELSGTREFRLAWWGSIIDYTVHGDYFWTGKGYGVNLALDDGFQPNRDSALRAPHNVHMTVLARSGVPGLALWGVFLGGWFFCMLRGVYRALRVGETERASAIIWIMAYSAACLVNATFDPYLEGPQGGIWFWALVGFGVALTAPSTEPHSGPVRFYQGRTVAPIVRKART